MLKAYLYLTKPGIIIGNLINAAGAFLFASAGHVNLELFVAALAGIGLVIASACVVNNFTDRNIDARMERTNWRALASGKIAKPQALMFAIILGYAGFLLLTIYTNPLTLLLGALAFFDYTVLYAVSKRISPWGTLVGTLAGSLPAVAGYTAVSGQMDGAAWLLLLILTLWQLPHFYAIAIYRLRDYQAAGLPVWPVRYGIKSAKIQIQSYILLFFITAPLMTVLGYAGLIYLVGMALVCVLWLRMAWSIRDSSVWSKQMFRFSLVVILTFSFLISLEGWV